MKESSYTDPEDGRGLVDSLRFLCFLFSLCNQTRPLAMGLSHPWDFSNLPDYFVLKVRSLNPLGKLMERGISLLVWSVLWIVAR